VCRQSYGTAAAADWPQCGAGRPRTASAVCHRRVIDAAGGPDTAVVGRGVRPAAVAAPLPVRHVEGATAGTHLWTEAGLQLLSACAGRAVPDRRAAFAGVARDGQSLDGECRYALAAVGRRYILCPTGG